MISIQMEQNLEEKKDEQISDDNKPAHETSTKEEQDAAGNNLPEDGDGNKTSEKLDPGIRQPDNDDASNVMEKDAEVESHTNKEGMEKNETAENENT